VREGKVEKIESGLCAKISRADECRTGDWGQNISCRIPRIKLVDIILIGKGADHFIGKR
jgi:hypothetical protein